MRYLIDREFRAVVSPRPARASASFALGLRRELSQRNRLWAVEHGYAHEVSLGAVPAVLYREDEAGRHGNFLDTTYSRIRQTPEWARRFGKVHTSAKRALLSRDPARRELDSSNSSDALLMNIFCYPDVLATAGIRQLLGVDADVQAVFGHKPGVPLLNGRRDGTEVDLHLGNLLVEAKLTEYDFQTAPRRLIERYRDLQEVFDLDQLDQDNDVVTSYQLVRGVLAANAAPGRRFCVLCDRRRPDLIDAWHRVMMTVRVCELRPRLQLLTWQELAATLPFELQLFLEEKYGVSALA